MRRADEAVWNADKTSPSVTFVGMEGCVEDALVEGTLFEHVLAQLA